MNRLTDSQRELLNDTANALSRITYSLVMAPNEDRFRELEDQIRESKAWIERKFGLDHVERIKGEGDSAG